MVSKNLPMGIKVVIAVNYWCLIDISRWGDLCAHPSYYLGRCCTSNLRLAIESGRWLTIPVSRDNRLCHFFSCNVVEMRHTLCWSLLYITPFTYLKCPSMFEDVVLGSLESFFHLHHQVDIKAYLMPDATALHHSKEWADLKPTLCTFSPIISLLTSWTLKLSSFQHYVNHFDARTICTWAWSNDRGEPVVSYRWTGWVWEITGWSSRLQEKYWSF